MRTPLSFQVERLRVQVSQSPCPPSQKCSWPTSPPARLMQKLRRIFCVFLRLVSKMVALHLLLHTAMRWPHTRTALYAYSMGGLSMDEMLVHMENGGRTYSRGKTPVVAVVSATCTI